MLVNTYPGQQRIYYGNITKPMAVMYRDILTVPKLSPYSLLHLRFFHASHEYLQNVAEYLKDKTLIQEFFGVEYVNRALNLDPHTFCELCQIVKARLLAVKSKGENYDEYEAGGYWAADYVFPPKDIEGFDGTKVILLLYCLRSRYMKAYFLKDKSANAFLIAMGLFMKWIKKMRHQFNVLLPFYKFKSDQEKSMISQASDDFCAENGIDNGINAAHAHTQNAHLNSFVSAMWTGLKAMFLTSNMNQNLFPLAVNHYVMFKNCLGWKNPYGEFSIPYHVLFKRIPTHLVSRLKIWGSLCWPITDVYSTNFDYRTATCYWVGLSERLKGTLVYDPRTNKVFVAGQLRVYEGLDQSGKLLKVPALTRDDLLDDVVYRHYSLNPNMTKVFLSLTI